MQDSSNGLAPVEAKCGGSSSLESFFLPSPRSAQPPATMSRQPFLIQFAQIHAEFRLPELQSVAELHGFPLDLTNQDASRPFAVLDLTEAQARLLAARCILIK
jgi:hypothetical protein